MYDLGIRVPRLDRTLVYLSLKILLALLMRERGAGHSPQTPFRRETHDLGGGDTKGRGSVYGEVCEEVEQPDVVRAEVEVGNGDGVRAGVKVGFLDGPSVH